MSPAPDRLVPSLSGRYKVIAPAWVTNEDCRELVEALEEAGAIPFRSNTRGGFGVSLALGGDGIEVELQGRACSVTIFNRTIGVIPVDEGKEAAVEEAERIAREAGPRRGRG